MFGIATETDAFVVDPIIAGLLKRLPEASAVWPESDRKLWLSLLEGAFKVIYRDEAPTAK